MDAVRYWLTLIMIMGLAPGILFWYAIHPFSRFWRRVGPVGTYTVLMIPSGLVMYGFFLVREPMLAVDFGTSYLTIVLSFLALAGAATIAVKRRRYLTKKILTGVPELSMDRYPGTLLKRGIYGRIRHPRYVELTLFVLAYALFGNHLAGYLAFLLTPPALWLVVVFEERELEERFGEEWRNYAREVPRVIPKGR